MRLSRVSFCFILVTCFFSLAFVSAANAQRRDLSFDGAIKVTGTNLGSGSTIVLEFKVKNTCFQKFIGSSYVACTAANKFANNFKIRYSYCNNKQKGTTHDDEGVSCTTIATGTNTATWKPTVGKSSVTKTLKVTLKAPTGLPNTVLNGSRFIEVFLDSGGKYGEKNKSGKNKENDNKKTAAITIAAKPDAVVKTLTVSPTTAKPGDTLTVKYQLCNTGKAANSKALKYRLYYSANSAIDINDTYLSHERSANLLAGACSTTYTVTTKVPNGAAAGTRYIGMIADYNGEEPEANENNNPKEVSFTVSSASEPTPEPTTEPTPEPTTEPTPEPTTEPKAEPVTEPTTEPTPEPTTEPKAEPTQPDEPVSTEPATDGGGGVDNGPQDKGDPTSCDNVTCNSGEYCNAGKCLKACGCTKCDKGKSCKDGVCVDDSCGGVSCAAGKVCEASSGRCIDDLCDGVSCSQGEICEEGSCIDDPCNKVLCYGGQKCWKGQCYDDGCIPKPTPAEEPTPEPVAETSEPDAGSSKEDTATDEGTKTEAVQEAASSEGTVSGDAGGGSADKSSGSDNTTSEGDGGAGCACQAGPPSWSHLILLSFMLLFFGRMRRRRSHP